MFTVLLEFTSVLFVVILLTVQSNCAWRIALFNVEENEQFESSSNNSLGTTTAVHGSHKVNSSKENEDYKEHKNNSTHSDDVKNKTKAGNDSLEEYTTDEPFVTEPMTALMDVKVHADESTTANVNKEGADKERSKRSKMLIGEVSDEEREYIKFELRRLAGLVEFLKLRELSPALDPPLDQLRTALDELMVDADELKSRGQGH